MTKITFQGNEIHSIRSLAITGSKVPNFHLTKTDFSSTSISDHADKKIVLNVFPGVDTGTCAKTVRKFNEEIAQARFCGTDGIENVQMLYDFRDGNF